MDDRKRRLLQKYVEAVDVDQQDIEVSSNHIRQVSRPAKIFWPDLVLSVTDLSCRKLQLPPPIFKLFLASYLTQYGIGYCHHNVVCLSVCLSARDAVHCGQTIHPMAKVSEQLNRRCPQRNTTVQLSTHTSTLIPQTSLPKSPTQYDRLFKQQLDFLYMIL